MKDKLESEEFYNLMQHYRMASMNMQDEVVQRYEEVKSWLRGNFKEIKPKSQRSIQLNKYYFGVVLKIFAGELGWSVEDAHDYFKSIFLIDYKTFSWGKRSFDYAKSLSVSFDYDEASELPIIQSTTKLNNQEFMDYIKKIQQFAAEQGIDVPNPNEADFELIAKHYLREY